MRKRERERERERESDREEDEEEEEEKEKEDENEKEKDKDKRQRQRKRQRDLKIKGIIFPEVHVHPRTAEWAGTAPAWSCFPRQVAPMRAPHVWGSSSKQALCLTTQRF